MSEQDCIDWLLRGDPSIQYQAYRDLLDQDRPEIRARIAHEGWGARFLAHRNADGSWGERFYQPKWTSTHYTVLDLKTLGVAPDNPQIRDSILQVFDALKGPDGGILCSAASPSSDVCVNGMVVNYASYFRISEARLHSIIDFLMREQMGDGGFNCFSNRSGASHSSLHSTISVLEGLQEYLDRGLPYRREDARRVSAQAREFILRHRFYKSDRTGQVIRQDFLQLSFPPRWYFNILRCLDHFRASGAPWDERMADAFQVLHAKRRRDGRWPLQAARAGKVHFRMEEGRHPSRWNTLMALRVLRPYPEARLD